MKTEQYFSVYGSGYSEERYEGFQLFRKSIPKRAVVVAWGVGLSALLVGVLIGVAHSVMTNAHAGAEFAIRHLAN